MVRTLNWDKMLTGLLESSDGGIDTQQLKRNSTWFVVIQLLGSKTIEATSSSRVMRGGGKKDKNGWMRENIAGELPASYRQCLTSSIGGEVGVTAVA